MILRKSFDVNEMEIQIVFISNALADRQQLFVPMHAQHVSK